MTPTGFEHPPENVEKTVVSKASGAKSGALSTDCGLDLLIDAWPTLPDAMKAGILAMIAAASKK